MPTSNTCVELPVFDISKPLSPSCFSSLSVACKEWGFFHISNHGVPKHLCRKLLFLSNSLFNLPYESKIKAGPSSSQKTYTPHFIASPFFESLRVSGPNFFISAQSSAEAIFEHPEPEFSETLEEYGNKMSELSKRIVEIVLMSLGEDIAKKFKESEFGNCHGYMRVNKYTPPKNMEESEDHEGLGKHTDMSCITILYQDEIGGLQVRSMEGKWLDIKPCQDTLAVNIGDLMHAWSNGKLRSCEHRVVLERNIRFSIAFFWCFEDENVVFAPSQVVGEGNLRLYKAFVCGDYLRFRENSQKGKFEKVGFTVKDFLKICP